MKLAIITGASAGIGLAAAELFLAGNYNVINISRRATENPNITDFQCDLSDENQIQECVDGLLNEIALADSVALVHNAAYLCGDSAIDANLDDLKKSLAVNVIAPTILNKQLSDALPPSSSILYTGSTLSEKAVPNAYSYVTSKHAVAGMMKSTCQDLFGKQMHSACICPGFTDTEMLRSHIPDEEVLLEVGGQNGFGRLVTPNEIARLIVWAHENPAINGSVLHANLGQAER